jgi:hypothetical protein
LLPSTNTIGYRDELALIPLTHHRTCGCAYGGSTSTLNAPLIAEQLCEFSHLMSANDPVLRVLSHCAPTTFPAEYSTAWFSTQISA